MAGIIVATLEGAASSAPKLFVQIPEVAFSRSMTLLPMRSKNRQLTIDKHYRASLALKEWSRHSRRVI